MEIEGEVAGKLIAKGYLRQITVQEREVKKDVKHSDLRSVTGFLGRASDQSHYSLVRRISCHAYEVS